MTLLSKSWEQWLYDKGQGFNSFLQDTQTVAAEAICNIYSKYPDRNPLAAFANGYMDGVCSEVGHPLPEPLDNPYAGGGCPCVHYKISGTYSRFHDSDTIDPQYGIPFQSHSGWGVIKDVQVARITNPDRPELTRCVLTYSGTDVNCNPKDFSWILAGNAYTCVVESLEWIRQDGQPDICDFDNPDVPEYVPVDPDDFSKTVTINNYNTDGTVDKSRDYSLTVPTFLGPAFQMDVDLGGITLNVDLGGVSVNVGGGDSSGGDTINNITNITIEKEDPFTPDDTELIEPEEEEVEEDEETNELIDYVTVTITTPPKGDKTILFNNSDNNTFFAGYFRWTVETDNGLYSFPEMSVRKTKNIFKMPDYATGFKFYTVNGAVAKIGKYTRTIEPEGE